MTTADLSVAGGTVLVQKAHTAGWIKAQDGVSLGEGDEVQNLGPDYAASLRFFDGTVARLQPGASMRLAQMRTGRFNMPGSLYRLLDLVLSSGTVQMDVSGVEDERRDVSIHAMNATIDLGGGQFDVQLISRPVDGVEQCCMSQIVTRRGVAHITAANQVTDVMAGQRALTPMGGVTLPLSPAVREFLINTSLLPDATGGFANWTVATATEPGGPVGGVTPLASPDGPGIHISRPMTNVHGETGIRQDLNLDVRDLTSLNLVFHYRLHAQTLSGGGRDGSEYPLMVRVTYAEASGGLIPWFHGFYLVPPDTDTRTTVQAQEIVSQDTWQVYEGHLLELAPRPSMIRSVELLGSGWSYDVEIAQVSLTGS